MSWERQIASALEANDIELVAHVPDGALAGLIEFVEADEAFTTVRVNREEEAVGVLAGGWLGGRRGALLCQSSGLATSINALASLALPARIPFLGVVSRRGDLGEFNLAQVPFGYAMPGLLDDLGVRNHRLGAVGDAEVERLADMAAKTAFSTEEPYLLLVEPTLTGAKDEF